MLSLAKAGKWGRFCAGKIVRAAIRLLSAAKASKRKQESLLSYMRALCRACGGRAYAFRAYNSRVRHVALAARSDRAAAQERVGIGGKAAADAPDQAGKKSLGGFPLRMSRPGNRLERTLAKKEK